MGNIKSVNTARANRALGLDEPTTNAPTARPATVAGTGDLEPRRSAEAGSSRPRLELPSLGAHTGSTPPSSSPWPLQDVDALFANARLNAEQQVRQEQSPRARKESPTTAAEFLRTLEQQASERAAAQATEREQARASLKAAPLTETSAPVPTLAGTSDEAVARASEIPDHLWTYDVFTEAVAARGIPEFTDARTLSRSVMSFVGDGLKAAAEAGKKPLVVFGEAHNRLSSIVVALSVMKAIDLAHGPGATFLVELAPADLEKLNSVMEPHYEPMRSLAYDSEEAVKFDRRLAAKLDYRKAGDPPYDTRILAVKIDAARRLGFDVGGFNGLHGKPLKEREDAMVAAIKAHLENSDAPTFVLAGLNHLATIHAELTDSAHTIALGSIREDRYSEDSTASSIARSGYMVARPSIGLFAPADELEMEKFHYFKFASELGIPAAVAERC